MIMYWFHNNNPIHFTIIKNLQMIDPKFAFRSMIDRSGFDRSDRSFSRIVWPLVSRLDINPLAPGRSECDSNKANLRDLIAATGLVISNWIQIVNFSARVTVKFDRWPWKPIGHLYYAISSSMHHFIAIGELKLELHSGNAQFGSKSMIFFSRVTLKFDVWPWKTIGHLFYAT